MASVGASGHGVVVCGAGAIGVCVSYFLGVKGVKVTIVDRCGVAAAASGKAGGFLALDWCDGSPVGKLARESFRLHQLLADQLGGADRYGYRRLDTLSVEVREQDDAVTTSSSGGADRGNQRGATTLPGWVDGAGVRSASSIGSRTTTAQVHPELFTKTLFERCTSEHGARFMQGRVEDVVVSESGMVTGVLVDGNLVPTDCVVLALGPWSGKLKVVSRLTGGISGLKAHSVVLRPREDADEIGAQALFLRYRTKDGRSMEPEVYPRPTGEVYLCGMTEEDAELPEDAYSVQPREGAARVLASVASNVSSSLGDAQVAAEQACFLPISPDGLPLIGKLPGAEGVYIATGHSCWGILNAPATGAALAELISSGSSSALKAFDPSRFS